MATRCVVWPVSAFLAANCYGNVPKLFRDVIVMMGIYRMYVFQVAHVP